MIYNECYMDTNVTNQQVDDTNQPGANQYPPRITLVQIGILFAITLLLYAVVILPDTSLRLARFSEQEQIKIFDEAQLLICEVADHKDLTKFSVQLGQLKNRYTLTARDLELIYFRASRRCWPTEECFQQALAETNEWAVLYDMHPHLPSQFMGAACRS